MKVLPFKIPKPEKEVLVYQEDHEEVFYDQLHQHDEIQISYVKQGSGSLIVGGSINYYKTGDTLIIGENVSHVFKSDSSFTSESIMYSLFFTKTSFGKEFFELTDLKRTNEFFKDAVFGIRIIDNQTKIIKIFEKLKNQTKIGRIASLLKILNIIILSEKQPLSSFGYRKKYTEDEGKRMRAVFEYTIENYDKAISLETVAQKANISKNAFCRYFKKCTNKTFFQFLIEIRIENACKLLYRDKELGISSISELCGFQNIANFNRKFKKLKGITPSQYRFQFSII